MGVLRRECMELFVPNDELIPWELQLPASLGATRLNLLVLLAWHLRQRDTPRAVKLVEEARAVAAHCGLTPWELRAIHARLELVMAEAQWLFAQLAHAQSTAVTALQAFTELHDHIGCADCHWLLAWIATDDGNFLERDAQLQQVAACAQTAGASLRMDVADATMVRWLVFTSPQAARLRWGERFARDVQRQSDALATWSTDVLGMLTNADGDIGGAARYTMQAFDAAMATGQLRTAIIACTNVAEDFNRLNDHQSALEWMQKGLDLARPTQWPRSVGACMMHMAETLRYLGNLDAAQDLLSQALQTLTPLASSRPYAIALQYQGDLALNRSDYATALQAFKNLETKADALNQLDFHVDARRGQAHALSALGHPQEALLVGHAALASAEKMGEKSRMIETLMVLANIHAQHGSLPHPQTSDNTSAALFYLLEALRLARSIPGYTISSKLFEQLGHEYSKIGDYAQAYAMTKEAVHSKELTHNQMSTNLAIAIQVSHQTWRAQAENEQNRQLAAVEAKRAEALLQNNKTLELLGAIGQEITAALDAQAIYTALYTHVSELLDLTSFDVYLFNAQDQAFQGVYSVEAGHALPLVNVPYGDPSAYTARCGRERREFLINLDAQTIDPNLAPGTLQTRSMLFAPLMIGERLLGVMTIQSLLVNAYGERECSIFRTLCAYGAIALDNAGAYTLARNAQAHAEQALAALRSTQERLLQSEKVAALGRLIAGVSHELNTPLGNGLVATTTLRNKVQEFQVLVDAGNLRRSSLEDFLLCVDAGSDLAMRSINRSIELVSRFRELTMDSNRAERRDFQLREVLQGISANLKAAIKPTGHMLIIDSPDNVLLNSYPEVLGKTLTNLAENAIRHGLNGHARGELRVVAEMQTQERIVLRVIDNGIGISVEDQSRIFDPFFTTKFGHGGSGLGLHLAYNMVHHILGGSLSVVSTLGNGSEFILNLPRIAPQAQIH